MKIQEATLDNLTAMVMKQLGGPPFPVMTHQATLKTLAGLQQIANLAGINALPGVVNAGLVMAVVETLGRTLKTPTEDEINSSLFMAGDGEVALLLTPDKATGVAAHAGIGIVEYADATHTKAIVISGPGVEQRKKYLLSILEAEQKEMRK